MPHIVLKAPSDENDASIIEKTVSLSESFEFPDCDVPLLVDDHPLSADIGLFEGRADAHNGSSNEMSAESPDDLKKSSLDMHFPIDSDDFGYDLSIFWFGRPGLSQTMEEYCRWVAWADFFPFPSPFPGES